MEVIEIVGGGHPDRLRLGGGRGEDEPLVVDIAEGGVAVFLGKCLP